MAGNRGRCDGCNHLPSAHRIARSQIGECCHEGCSCEAFVISSPAAAPATQYRVARNPDVSRAEMATAHRYSTLEAASADMGEGVVFNDAGEILVFHERHFALLEHRGSSSGGHPRMANFTPPPAEGEYTRGGLRVRRWPRLEPGMVALELPGRLDHVIVPETIADEVTFVRNPFQGLHR